MFSELRFEERLRKTPNRRNITVFSSFSARVWTGAKSFYLPLISQGSRGRLVVKAMDLKSIGVSPRRFECCRLR